VGYNGLQVTDLKCKALLAKADEESAGYYAYNLYDTCWYQNNLNPPHRSKSRSTWGPPARHLFRGALLDYPCGGPQALFHWLEHPDVKKALHVAPNAYFFSGDNGVGFNYTLTERNLLPFYKHLVYNTSIRVLVYNGDTDPGINSFTAQNWTSYLGVPEKESWRAWTLDSKQAVGGYVTRYEGSFDYLTIRGSGHMVSLGVCFFLRLFVNLVLYLGSAIRSSRRPRVSVALAEKRGVQNVLAAKGAVKNKHACVFYEYRIRFLLSFLLKNKYF